VKANLTEIVKDGEQVLDQVVHHNETAEIQQHGKTVAVIRRKAGVSGKELLRRLKLVRFTEAERDQLAKAMADGASSLSHAGSD
jgi:hypothetical protein